MSGEKGKQVDYFTTVLRGINIKDFIEDEDTRKKRGAPEGLDLPKINPLETPPGAPPAGGPLLPPGGAPAGGPPPPGGPLPPLGGLSSGGNPPPMGGNPPPMGGFISPENNPLPLLPPAPVEEDKNDAKIQELLQTINDIKSELQTIKYDAKIQNVLETVDDKYQELQDEIDIIKKRKVPSREYFDTEGVYSEHLFGMVTQMLDEFLPGLFEDVPDYHFLSSQISRTYKDGTVADALVSLICKIVKGKDRYDFKLEVPILNGLIQRPIYIERGARIIPLTKNELMREIESMTYRQIIPEVEEPYAKEQLFSNIGDNMHRRPDDQKVYNVRRIEPKFVGLPPKNKWTTRQTE